MAAGKTLSGAERSKLFRERQKQRLLASGGEPAKGKDAHEQPVGPGPRASSASSPTHTTEPVSVGGPAEFASVLTLPAIEAGDGAPGAKEEPFAPPPPPEAPPPPVTPEEAQLFAMGVVGYWNLGIAALLAKHPELVQLADELPPPMREGMQKFDGYLYQAAVRVGVKYGLRIPYADEAVCLAAIGVASYGLFGKVDPNVAKVVSGPPPGARNVTPKEERPSSPPPPSSAPKGPPGPLPDTASKPWRFE